MQWVQNTASASYNSLQANYRKRVGHGLTFQAAYTWSHAIDDSSDGAFLTGVDDWNDLKRWRGNSEFDRRQILQLNYVYDLPFFSHSSSRFLKSGLGGWQVSGIASFFKGIPLNFSCNHSGNGSGIGKSMKCNTIGDFKVAKSVGSHPTFGPTPSGLIPPRSPWRIFRSSGRMERRVCSATWGETRCRVLAATIGILRC